MLVLYVNYSLLFLVSYVFSSIPWGVLIARKKGIDLKKIGSGNIGATNVYRSLGLKWALLVFFLDAFKGFGAVYLALYLYASQPFVIVSVAFIVMLGHNFSVFLGFRGGKGAATGIGVVFALSPVIATITFVFALFVILITRVVSVATLSSCFILPILFYVYGFSDIYVVFIAIISGLVILMHKENIKRIIQGREKKIVKPSS